MTARETINAVIFRVGASAPAWLSLPIDTDAQYDAVTEILDCKAFDSLAITSELLLLVDVDAESKELPLNENFIAFVGSGYCELYGDVLLLAENDDEPRSVTELELQLLSQKAKKKINAQ